MRGLASPAPAHPAAPWLPYQAGRPNIWRKSYPSIHSLPAAVKPHIARVAAILSCVHALREMPSAGGSEYGDVGAVGKGVGARTLTLTVGAGVGTAVAATVVAGPRVGRMVGSATTGGRVGVGLGSAAAATAVMPGVGTAAVAVVDGKSAGPPRDRGGHQGWSGRKTVRLAGAFASEQQTSRRAANAARDSGRCMDVRDRILMFEGIRLEFIRSCP